MPAVLGRKGAVRTIDVPLSREEKTMLEESAKALKEMVQEAK
jgi:L-lactate dehydrogenase